MTDLHDDALSAAVATYAERIDPDEHDALTLAVADLIRDGSDPLARAAVIANFARAIIRDVEEVGRADDGAV